MTDITYNVSQRRQIRVNGHVFEILKTDKDVIAKAAELHNSYSRLTDPTLTGETDLTELVSAVESIISFIDEMLGDGATLTITEGRPLGIVDSIKLMTLICQAIVEEYNSDVSAKYE